MRSAGRWWSLHRGRRAGYVPRSAGCFPMVCGAGGRGWAIAAAVMVALVPAVALGARAGSPTLRPLAASGVAGNNSSFFVDVLWNGEPLSHAASPSSAFVLGPGERAVVNFTFAVSGPGLGVTNATLVVWFLGTELARTLLPTTSTSTGTGYAQLNWSLGSLVDLTEGVYEVDAELATPAGHVVFDEPFYVHAETPAVLGSAIALALVILAGLDTCWVVLVLRERWVHLRGPGGR